MNVYLDTNIVVADAVEDHERHANAVALFEEVQRRRWTPVISAHGLSETYAVLTGTPFSHRISPAEAWRVAQENVLSLFEIGTLGRSGDADVLQNCAARAGPADGYTMHSTFRPPAKRNALASILSTSCTSAASLQTCTIAS